MSNQVIPAGSINPNATIAAGVVVLENLEPGQISGISTNIIGAGGTSTWGPVNAQVTVANPTDFANQLGSVLPQQYDLGTFVNAASLQGTVASFVCVRVTDGTDTMASADLLDAAVSPVVGLTLTAKYSGTTGNTLQAFVTAGIASGTYNVSIGRPGYVAELFSNIGGTGNDFWENVASAINNGQSGVRGPSELVIASANGSVSAITVTDAGIYPSQPTVAVVGTGSGATVVPHFKAVQTMNPIPLVTSQSGSGSYAPGDTLTAVGGTFSTAMTGVVTNTQVASATIASGGTGGTPGTQTVTGTTGTGTKFQASVTVSGGGVITAVLGIIVGGNYTVNPTSLTAEPVTGASLTGATLNIKMGIQSADYVVVGNYTTLPTNPISVTTNGAGTGALFSIFWGLLSVAVTAGGVGYDDTTTLSVTGGGGIGGAGTVSIGSITAPALDNNPYVFTGGTNGDGVSPADLIGVDGEIPTGMFVLRNSGVSLFSLVDNDDSTTFGDQDIFASQIGAQAVVVGVPGQTVSQGISDKNSASLADNYCVYLLGDWCNFLDTNNGGITRLISPQGFYCGLMGNLLPEENPLNKQVFGILSTQKTSQKQVYSNQDQVNMTQNGIEVITNPIPSGSIFGCITGRSAGTNLTTNLVNIQRMANFLGYSLSGSGILSQFIGQLQTTSVRVSARNCLVSFLKNLESEQMIQDSIVVLNATNNPQQQVQLGFMQANVTVQLFSVIVVFLIDLNVGTSSIQSSGI